VGTFLKSLMLKVIRYRHGNAMIYEFLALARKNTIADISILIAAYFRGSY